MSEPNEMNAACSVCDHQYYDHEKAVYKKVLVDVARYLGNRIARSDGEELILARCREALKGSI